MRCCSISAVVLAALAGSVLATGVAPGGANGLSPRQLSPSTAVPTTTGSTPTTVTPSTTVASIPPSPVCSLHVDHWHCDGSTADESAVDPASEASCSSALAEDYSLPLHIVALFVVFVASAIGVFTPVTVAGWTKGRRMMAVWFVLQYFGTGVIVATAYVHLLMQAFVMFANPCLGKLAYDPTAPAIAMAATLLVFLVDFFGGRYISRTRKEATPDDEAAGGPREPALKEEAKVGHDHSFSKVDPAVFPAGDDKRAQWEVQLLEAGTIFHSIMIGVTLGAQGDSGFIPTFCAIVFHQLFEGFGLGTRIATLKFPNGGSWKRWVMCSLFAVITSIGIGIGIAVRQNFNLNGRGTILAIGILNSISAGILLYAGIAQLLVGEWLAGEMRTASTRKVAVGLLSMGAGLFSMSLVGKWA